MTRQISRWLSYTLCLIGLHDMVPDSNWRRYNYCARGCGKEER